MKGPSFQYAGREWRLVRSATDRKRPEAEQAKCPWYVRYQRPDNRSWQWKKIGTAFERSSDLVARAKAFLRGLDENRNAIDRWLDQVLDSRSLVVSKLAAPYKAAGCPDRGGHPRTGAQLAEQLKHLEGALAFFGNRSPRVLGPADCLEFRDWKRARLTVHGADSVHAGARTCELNLSALSNCFQWCVLTRRLEVNPLESRPALRNSEDIEHHHRFQPETDEEFHNLARWCFQQSDLFKQVSGAQILFHGMTGLRAGEGAACLQWPAENRPHNAPGMRQHCRPDGQPVEWLHVRRSKGGINPVVRVHGALAEFLTAWRAHTAQAWPGNPWMLPGDTGGHATTDFTRDLHAASAAIGSPENRFGETRRTAHALRGFYVSVRRDAGVPDALIAAELGQGGGDRLIRTTYGAPDAFASGRLDWMPVGEPAWKVLGVAPEGVLEFKAA